MIKYTFDTQLSLYDLVKQYPQKSTCPLTVFGHVLYQAKVWRKIGNLKIDDKGSQVLNSLHSILIARVDKLSKAVCRFWDVRDSIGD